MKSSAVDRQSLFLKLPSPVRRALIVWQSLSHRRTRYGSEYQRTRELLDESQFWPAARMRSFQQAQLLRLLVEARSGTEHYADVLGGISDERLVEIANELDIGSLPLLEKRTLKANPARFFNRHRETATTSMTSGSTGSPLKVEYDAASMQQRFAHLHRLRSWGGVGPFERNVRFSGRQIVPSARHWERPWASAPFENMLLVSTYHLDERSFSAIVERAKRFRPALIDGYSSAIEPLARYCASHAKTIPGLRMVITSAETLSLDTRRAIESGLGARVFDYYSASEGVPLICQCEHGLYHVTGDSGLFEFLAPDGTPAPAGSEAEIVVTSFCQWKTPLIRYRTGDLALLHPNGEVPACPCGRSFPTIAGLVGRVEDQVLTRDGRQIGMFPYRTLKHVPGIAEAQIHQNAFDAFRVALVLDGSRRREDVQLDIERIFAAVLGYELRVDFEVVTTIPRGPNGKLRALVRAFDPARVELH